MKFYFWCLLFVQVKVIAKPNSPLSVAVLARGGCEMRYSFCGHPVTARTARLYLLLGNKGVPHEAPAV